jgi:hypothetical protein
MGTKSRLATILEIEKANSLFWNPLPLTYGYEGSSHLALGRSGGLGGCNWLPGAHQLDALPCR